MSKRTETPEARARRIANLKPRKKGEPGSPNAGRPKGSLNRATMMQKLLFAKTKGQSPDFDIKEGEMLIVDRINLKQIEKALAGDSNAYDRVMDSALGKVAEKIKVNQLEENDEIPNFENEEQAMRALQDAIRNAKS